jgi:prepilin-type N-terminal cleavage/methylation domain-containing protein
MKKGFTLIELLIVITIIGILAVAFLPSVLGAPAKARDVQRISSIQKIATTLSTKAISGGLSAAFSAPAKFYCINAGTNLTITGDASTTPVTVGTPADFGGKLPSDPKKLIIQGGSNVACAAGEYLMQYMPTGYTYAIYGAVESADNGNMDCGTDTTKYIVTGGTTLSTPVATTYGCYAVLVQ